MAEISVKSASLQDRVISTYRFIAKVTLNGACCSTIDIGGITLAGTTTGFTFSGFECASGLALDSGRDGLVNFIHHGTVSALPANGDYAACNPFYPGDLTILTGTISGTAGSRVATFDVNLGDAAVSVDLTADTITNAYVEFILPVKLRDF